MVLGLKGAFSVMESSAIRQRAFEAKLEKAARGELFALIAVGYVLGADGRLQKDPNARTRETVGLVFSKFREPRSDRATQGRRHSASRVHRHLAFLAVPVSERGFRCDGVIRL